MKFILPRIGICIWVVSYLFLPTNIFAQSPKRIYIANDDHTDYMWSANEATYQQAFSDMIKYYLDQADSTVTNPSDYQGRFNADGSYWVWNYQKNNTADFSRLITRLRDGHITMPLNTLAVIFGGQPAEAVIRGMYYAGRLKDNTTFVFL
jgi:alpha-mannosidase